MDPALADVLKGLEWPVTLVTAGVIVTSWFREPIKERIRTMSKAQIGSNSVEFQGQVQTTMPVPPAQTESLDQAKAALRIAATGWRFERYLRVIYPAQLEFLMELQVRKTLPNKVAQLYYEKMSADLRAAFPYLNFWTFLTSNQLVSNSPDANGENQFSITATGEKLLEYRTQFFSGTAWPYFDAAPPVKLER